MDLRTAYAHRDAAQIGIYINNFRSSALAAGANSLASFSMAPEIASRVNNRDEIGSSFTKHNTVLKLVTTYLDRI